MVETWEKKLKRLAASNKDNEISLSDFSKIDAITPMMDSFFFPWTPKNYVAFKDLVKGKNMYWYSWK